MSFHAKNSRGDGPKARNLHYLPLMALTSIALVIGCASPGPPRPPSLNLPKQATELAAERIADTVQLHWTTPEKTSDELDIKGPVIAEICREVQPLPGAFSKPACLPVLKVPVVPGPSHTTDVLPTSLIADPVLLLTYRVRLLNAAGRSGPPSLPAYAAAGAAPSPIASLHAVAIPNGVLVEWSKAQSPSPSDTVELDRIDAARAQELSNQRPKSKPASKPLVKKSSGARSTTPKPPAAPRQKSQSDESGQPPAEVHLRAASSAPGTIDRTALTGVTYTYTAQRIRSVVAGTKQLKLLSDPSTAATLTVRDTFPPAIPAGLAAVPTPAADPSQKPSIDLSWEPDSESDLAGYLVYRRLATSSETPVPLTAIPITAAAFRDFTAIPGQRYAYSVTAIDTSGNQSKPASEVQEQLDPTTK